jgi:hypothetical protein
VIYNCALVGCNKNDRYFYEFFYILVDIPCLFIRLHHDRGSLHVVCVCIN